MSFQGYSVLIPVAPWEQACSLHRCLNSIYRQHLPPAQIVVSIDGLLPQCLSEVLDDYVSRYPFVDLTIIEAADVAHLPSGVGPTLQRGLSACCCEFVMRLDTDDVAQPQRASEQLEVMLSHPSLAVVGSSLAEIDASGRHTSVRLVPHSMSAIKRISFWRNPMNHPTVMFRTVAVNAVGGYTSCPAFEDYHLWLRLLKADFQLQNQQTIHTVATAGPALISRRYGLHYAVKELSFLYRSAKEGLIPLYQVCVLIVLRVPTRLLPRFFLAQIMHQFLRGPAYDGPSACRACLGQQRDSSS